jgi:hypothetical protein
MLKKIWAKIKSFVTSPSSGTIGTGPGSGTSNEWRIGKVRPNSCECCKKPGTEAR